MKIDFDAIRIETIRNFNELVGFLDSGIKKGECTVDATKLRAKIETLRSNMIAIASCYDTEGDSHFLGDEINSLKKPQVPQAMASARDKSVREVVEVLQPLFELPGKGAPEVLWMSATTVIEYLQERQLIIEKSKRSFTPQNIGAALQKLGFVPKSVKRNGQVRKCYGILLR